MTVITFDTLAFVKKLEGRGFQPEQAEGISEALKDVLSNADIPTKAEIKEAETQTRIEMTNLATKADLANTKVELLKWYVGIAAVQIIGLGFLILRTLGKS